MKNLNKKYIHESIKNYWKMRRNTNLDESILVEAALFIEETFDVYLTDYEICGENLLNLKDMETFIFKKLKVE